MISFIRSNIYIGRLCVEEMTQDDDSGKHYSFEVRGGHEMAEVLQGLIGGGMFGSSSEVDLLMQCREPLEKLCKKINKERKHLERVQENLGNTFADVDYVASVLGDREVGVSMRLFPLIHHHVTKSLESSIDGYLGLLARYTTYVEGHLEEGFEKNISRGAMHVAKQAAKLFEESLQVYVDTKISLPPIVKGVRKIFASYDQYLRDRFIRPLDEKNGKTMIEFIEEMRERRNGEEEIFVPQGEYVKIALAKGNPVLTDILLESIDAIPDYKETIGEAKKRRKGEPRLLSKFAVEDAASRIAAVADPLLWKYVQDPTRFFSFVGKTLEEYYSLFQLFEPMHQEMLRLPAARIMLQGNSAIIRKVLEDDGIKMSRLLRTIGQMDLDAIVQNSDDVLPENRKEVDQFNARDRLFKKLLGAYEDLVKIPDNEERHKEAVALVESAAKIKDEMKQIGMTEKARRLREDKLGDNEYYVGRQHGHGEFIFERKPAPKTKLNEVIGASFDVAKKHLNEIIETGEFARVMQLSAPGGKVKSNIFLIGPYGCGKTELARAVCGDERVIGAAVSIGNTLTAYMHESVGNIKRIYDQAVELRSEGRDMKPVILALDEFDGWFTRGEGNTDVDMKQIENVFLEVLDGMEEYPGIITMGMTNNPKAVPRGILRRFRYVDVVGQLTRNEREKLLRMYLGKRLPIHSDVEQNYLRWAEQLEDAPGDVIRKVADEVHFELVPPFIKAHPREARRMEKILCQREIKGKALSETDISYVRNQLQRYNVITTPDIVDSSLKRLLLQPAIRMQIDAARKVYQDSEQVLNELSNAGTPFGLKPRSNLFDLDR